MERAAPVSDHAEEQMEDLLAIRVAKDSYAMRVSEISGLTADRKIVGFPTPVAALLGMAGVRGVLVPAYSLALLLGYASEIDEPRWLALCGKEDCIGLAFGDFEFYLKVPRVRVYPMERNETARAHVTHVTRGTDLVRPVLNIPLLRATIQERCHGSVSKER
jgi:purine-binding chemotaxis protein CheW